MTRAVYYQQMRRLALAKRAEHTVETASLNLSAVRRIYKAEGIKIDYRDLKGHRFKAAYFCDGGDYSVLINKNLPKEPRLFALTHELKHHYVDQGEILDGKLQCGDYNANLVIEIAAEVFAAEFIYPEAEMHELARTLRIRVGACSAQQIVEFKRVCPAPVSYKFLVKRFEWFGFIPKGMYKKTQFQKLERERYGVPFYAQDWFKQARARNRVT